MLRRPSRYTNIEVKASRFLPPKGYFAISLFGKMLIRRENYAFWQSAKGTDYGRRVFNHERIHFRQAVSTHDSWFLYYLMYIYYYFRSRPLRYGHRAAYYANPFELEAYLHESDIQYLAGSGGADGWRKYAAMSAEERVRIVRTLKET